MPQLQPLKKMCTKLLAINHSSKATDWKLPGALAALPGLLQYTLCSSAAPCWGCSCHCQGACVHLEGTEPSLAPSLSLGRAEIAISCGHMHVHTGKEKNYLGSAAPAPLAPPASNQGLHTREMEPAQRCIPSPWDLAVPPTKTEAAIIHGKNPTPSGSFSGPLNPGPSPDRALTGIEHKRSPTWHLALTLAPLNQLYLLPRQWLPAYPRRR